MSSLFVLNKNIDRAGGSGLPVYDKLDHVFSKSNPMFNHTEGLIAVPAERVPTFQVHLPAVYTVATKFQYRQTRGANDFTGSIFTPPISVFQRVREFEKDGVLMAAWETTDASPLLVPAKPGRFLIEFEVSDGGFEQATYYTEEFITTF